MRLIDCFSSLISFALYSQNRPDLTALDSAEKIHARCKQFVEESRMCCQDKGYSEAQQEGALFAVVAWVDEYRLCAAEQADSQWLHYELQRTFFNTSNAGDEFYDRFHAIAAEDKELLEVYAYCLALGFRGRLYDDPEAFDDFCQQFLGAGGDEIGGSLPDLLFAEGYDPESTGTSGRRMSFLPSTFTLLFFFFSVCMVGGLYLLGNRSLQALYSSLPAVGL